MRDQVGKSLDSDTPRASSAQSPRWLIVATPVALVAVAMFWLLHRLSVESLHIDESRQIYPYPDGLLSSALQLMQQGQPPVDAIIGSVFVQAFGVSVFVARLPSALWAVTAVLSIYFLARNWLSPVGSFLVSLVLLFNPLFLFYSQYARPYAIALALFLSGVTLALARNRGAALGVMVVVVVLPWARIVEGGAGSLIVMCVFAWTWWAGSPQPFMRLGPRVINGRVFIALGFALAIVSSLLSISSVTGSSSDQYFAPDWRQAAQQVGVVVWELGRDQGLGIWLWLLTCLVILVGMVLAAPRMRVLTLAVISLPAVSILAIVILSPIPVYERYEYFAVPILCLVPLLVADLLRRKSDRTASWSAGIVSLSLVAVVLPRSMGVQSDVDFIPYAELARTQASLPSAYLVSSDYSIYELADTAPSYQDVPSGPRYLPWITDLVFGSGPAPSHLILIAPIDVLDLKVRRDVREDYPEGFKTIPLESRDARGLLEVSLTLPEGAAMKTALAAIRLAKGEGNDSTLMAARSWICELRSRDAWPQALDDSRAVLAETDLAPCDSSE